MLLPQTELKLFSGQINLVLLNDIIAFVLSTSEATYTQKRALSKHCIFLDQDADGGAVQAKYGFLYLGELLERYEERFGASIQDLRAIALALGYTKEITTDAMFIGSQRTDFLRKLNRMADGDLYMTGALYLLTDEDRALCEVMTVALQEQIQSEQWQDLQHIPHPSTWLHGARWMDEMKKQSGDDGYEYL